MTDEKESMDINVSKETPVRDHLVNTAVNFLLNPDVQKRHDQSKIQFLRKKGLTEAEITAAFEKAKLDFNFVSSSDSSPQFSPNYPLPVPPHYINPSIWSRLSNFSSPIIVLGVAIYGLHHLYQSYIKPWLFGKDAKNDSLAYHVKILTDNLTTLTDTVSKLHESIEKQNEEINKLVQIEGCSYAPTPIILEDLRREVNSLKSILINRHQFPAVPQLQSTKPTIPSWQLPAVSEEQETKDLSEDETAVKQNTEKKFVDPRVADAEESENLGNVEDFLPHAAFSEENELRVKNNKKSVETISVFVDKDFSSINSN